jgi:allophanate hydrolase
LVAGAPALLGIGDAVFDDGSTVKSFICELHAVGGATDITRYGGWRHYLSQALSLR